MTRQFFSRLRSLWNWNRKESELDDEIRFHLSEEADERAAAGLTRPRRESRRPEDFGNTDPHPRGDARRLGLGVRRAPDPGRSWRASDDATRSRLFRVGGADARARHWSDDGHPQRRERTAPASAAVRRRRSAGRAVCHDIRSGASTGTPRRFSTSRRGEIESHAFTDTAAYRRDQLNVTGDGPPEPVTGLRASADCWECSA